MIDLNANESCKNEPAEASSVGFFVGGYYPFGEKGHARWNPISTTRCRPIQL